MKVPGWLEKEFCLDKVKAFEEHIYQAELKTSAEIIPMVVKESVPRYIEIMAALVYASLFQYLLLVTSVETESWDQHSVLWEYLFFPVVSLMFYLCIHFNSSCFRLLIPKSIRTFYSNLRAEIEFYRAGTTNTEGATGVLIFFSLREHVAIILADKSISEKVESDFWEDTLKQGLEKASKQGLAESLRFCVNRVADLLQKQFPRATDDVNEIEDVLIIKE
jgi:putative membrane protein